MTEVKKLLSFVLKDEFSLNESEIQKRAENVAEEQAFENGWSNITVKLSGKPTQDSKFHCYPFDVFGREGGSENNNTSESDNESTHSSNGFGIAAQPSL